MDLPLFLASLMGQEEAIQRAPVLARGLAFADSLLREEREGRKNR